MRRAALWCVLAVALAAAPARADGPADSGPAAGAAKSGKSDAHAPQVIAVLEFDNQIASGETIDRVYFSDKVRGEIKRRRPDLGVMTRENVLQLLEASGKKLEDCVGQCEVETGRLLGADLVISGRITKIGTRYKLSLRMHATREGTLLASSSASGETVNALDDDTQRTVEDLIDVLGPAPQSALAAAQGANGSAPAVKPTTLVIESEPGGAEISIDGFTRGRTPLAVDGLAPGNHQVSLQLLDHAPAQTTAMVRAGETSKVRLTLVHQTGRVALSLNAAGRCELGDKSVSLAAGSIEMVDVPTGRATAHCAADGFLPGGGDVEIKSGGTASLRVELEPDRGPPKPKARAGWLLGAGAAATVGGAVMVGLSFSKVQANQISHDATAGSTALIPASPLMPALSLSFGVLSASIFTALDPRGMDLGPSVALGMGIGAVLGFGLCAVPSVIVYGGSYSVNGWSGSDTLMCTGSVVLGWGAGLVIRGLVRATDDDLALGPVHDLVPTMVATRGPQSVLFTPGLAARF